MPQKLSQKTITVVNTQGDKAVTKAHPPPFRDSKGKTAVCQEALGSRLVLGTITM